MVLAARESPLSTIHLRNLYELSRMGVVIMPLMLTYYRRPVTLEEGTRYTAERILGQFGLCQDMWEWQGMEVVTVHSWTVHCAARSQANTVMGPESGLLP